MPWKLAVLMGGPSPERVISLQTGAAMAEALRGQGHAVTTYDLDRTTFATLDAQRPDCVVLALHGVPGEDGSVQAMLDLLDIPYTGSGQRASAIAIDKVLTKRLATAVDIRGARDVAVDASEAGSASTLIETAGLRYPLIIKGSTAGSTIGLTKIAAADGVAAAIATALAVSPVALIEECAVGVEISVPLLGNGIPRVLPTPEIVSDNELFDYEAKYTPGMSRHVYPPRCDPARVQQAEAQAIALYRLLGCAGCGRADFIIQESGPPIFLELNTLPGMTAVSILPDAAAQVGIGFAELCETLVQLGIEAAATRSGSALPESSTSLP